MENKFKKAIDMIVKKDDKSAKKIIREAIQKNQKYLDYKKRLCEMGLDLKKIDVPDALINSIKDMLKDYDKAVKLKILDTVYKQIATNAGRQSGYPDRDILDCQPAYP